MLHRTTERENDGTRHLTGCGGGVANRREWRGAKVMQPMFPGPELAFASGTLSP